MILIGKLAKEMAEVLGAHSNHEVGLDVADNGDVTVACYDCEEVLIEAQPNTKDEE